MPPVDVNTLFLQKRPVNSYNSTNTRYTSQNSPLRTRNATEYLSFYQESLAPKDLPAHSKEHRLSFQENAKSVDNPLPLLAYVWIATMYDHARLIYYTIKYKMNEKSVESHQSSPSP